MKKYYTLIGTDRPLESWVITYEDVNPHFPLIDNISDMISATPWPIIKFSQIPQRLLNEDPGFPILLRDDPEIPLPPWCHRPVLPSTTNYSNKYLIATETAVMPQKVLFIISGVLTQSWETLCSLYPATEHKWIYLGASSQDNKPNFSNEISLTEIIHFNLYLPDLLVDLNFGILDTYTLLHIFCFQHGVLFWPVSSLKDYSVRQESRMSRAKIMIME
jgi:hypothetical protein